MHKLKREVFLEPINKINELAEGALQKNKEITKKLEKLLEESERKVIK